jgi:uncharacterized protein (UPF0332 family)
MKEEIKNLIEKAKRSFEAGKQLYESGFYDFSVSRLYYAMFYCAEALLLTKGLSFSKHSAVISNFGKHFIKTGKLPQELHSSIINAFKDRQIGDYEIVIKITKEEAERHLRNAEEFIKRTIKYLESLGYGEF